MPTPRQVSFQHAEKKRSQSLKILLQKPGKASQAVTMCSHRSPFGCQGTELVAPGLTTTFSCLPFPGCFPDPVTSTFLMLFPIPHFPVFKTCHPANHQFLWYYSQFPHFLDSSFFGEPPKKVHEDGEGSGGGGRRCLSSNHPRKGWASQVSVTKLKVSFKTR